MIMKHSSDIVYTLDMLVHWNYISLYEYSFIYLSILIDDYSDATWLAGLLVYLSEVATCAVGSTYLNVFKCYELILR